MLVRQFGWSISICVPGMNIIVQFTREIVSLPFVFMPDLCFAFLSSMLFKGRRVTFLRGIQNVLSCHQCLVVDSSSNFFKVAINELMKIHATPT